MSGSQVFRFNLFLSAPLFKISLLVFYDILVLFVLTSEPSALTSGWNLQERGEILGDWEKAELVPVLIQNGKGGPYDA